MPDVLDYAAMREILQQRIAGEPWPGLFVFAERVGVKPEHIERVVAGSQEPSWKLLRALGLTRERPPAVYRRVE